MMKYTLLLLVVIAGCSQPKKRHQSIVLGQCYYYDHQTEHPHRPFAEKVNPFYYRALSRKRGRINMEMSYQYRGVWEKDTMHQSVKQLGKYSQPVDCNLVLTRGYPSVVEESKQPTQTPTPRKNKL